MLCARITVLRRQVGVVRIPYFGLSDRAIGRSRKGVLWSSEDDEGKEEERWGHAQAALCQR